MEAGMKTLIQIVAMVTVVVATSVLTAWFNAYDKIISHHD
ncbi:MAG: hypothetical protein Rsou_0320 [Candidatus Ruthia sp. Asou_11_S2]|nr:hypothetical protein [Candidatus Ruthia sp. Asou_11_S2]